MLGCPPDVCGGGLPPLPGAAHRAWEKIPPPVSEATDDTARTVVVPRAVGERSLPFQSKGTTDPAWELVQELPVFERLAEGARFAVQFDRSLESLVPLPMTDTLATSARQAVNRAPTWLQKELEDQFSRMTTAQQTKWGDYILAATDPKVDETAFLVAHISKDDLAASNFYPRLIRDSAKYAYEVDPYLAYVEVVDYGSAAGGGDYYTTLRYQVELDGVVSSVEFPREFYYWWVISPRGSDEFPTYIDPIPCSPAGTPPLPHREILAGVVFLRGRHQSGLLRHRLGRDQG